MAAKKPTRHAASKAAAGKTARTPGGRTTAKRASSGAGFTPEERAAMRERAREVRNASRSQTGGEVEDDVLAKIAAMAPHDRALAERIHALIKANVPDLSPRLWYGMPAYARDGKVVCFFQDARKFKTRYATLGFSDKAALDDGRMWPTVYALTELTAAEEERIAALLKRAVK